MGKKENKFQSELIADLEEMFPGSIILKNDPNYIQGIPDLTILHGDRWATLECKKSAHETPRPNQPYLELAHRLDRETSGVMILAKTRKALVRLHEMMRDGEVHKSYRTLVLGDWVNDRQHVKVPLFKYVTSSGERRVRVDEEKGLPSHTIFQLIERFGDVSYLSVDLKTGRTHQIRVHAQYCGHPLVGDEKYGNFEMNKAIAKGCLGIPFKRMFLHAAHLLFKHPVTGAPMEISAPLPRECDELITTLRARKER